MSFGKFALAALFLFATSMTQAQVIVAPNSNTTTAGNTDNRFPFFVSGGIRYQQVYDASQFSTLSSPEYITQIAFRPSQFVREAFTTTLPDVQIDLSTISTAPDALSSTFANNVGSNDTVVLGPGPLTLSSSDTLGVFDTVITFTTPFLYNPSAGNLLLDIRNFDGSSSNIIGATFFDAENVAGDSVSRVFGPEGNPSATSGTTDSLGLITQFTFAPATTPEPGPVALLGSLTLTGAAFLRRRRARHC